MSIVEYATSASITSPLAEDEAGVIAFEYCGEKFRLYHGYFDSAQFFQFRQRKNGSAELDTMKRFSRTAEYKRLNEELEKMGAHARILRQNRSTLVHPRIAVALARYCLMGDAMDECMTQLFIAQAGSSSYNSKSVVISVPRLAAASSSLPDDEKRAERLKRKLDEKENEVKQMKKNCDSTRSKLDAQAGALLEARQNMASLLFSKQEYIKQLSHVKEALVTKNQQLREANESLGKTQHELTLQQDNVRQYERQVTALQQQLQTLTTMLQEQAAAPAPVVEEVVDLQEHKKALDAIQREHDQEKRQSEEVIRTLRKELQEQQSKNQSSTSTTTSPSESGATVTEREKWQLDMARANAILKCIDALSE